MKYFINEKTGGLVTTYDDKEAKRLTSIGFTEVTKTVYEIEYRKAYSAATKEW